MLLQARFFNQQWRIESDSQRLVRRHLADPNHVITEEELAGVRVGVLTISTEGNSMEKHLADRERGKP